MFPHFRILSLVVLTVVSASAAAKEIPCQPARWEKSMARFASADEKHLPELGGIVFVGSSSIRLWKLAEYFPKLEPLNRGFGGSEICDSLHYFDTLVTKHEPKAVVLYAGDNDVARGKIAGQVHREVLNSV